MLTSDVVRTPLAEVKNTVTTPQGGQLRNDASVTNKGPLPYTQTAPCASDATPDGTNGTAMTSTLRTPLSSANTNVAPPAKKQRLDTASGKKGRPSKVPAATNVNVTRPSFEQILIRDWLKLPQSSYCIYYDLGQTRTYRYSPTESTIGFSMLQMAAYKCPFELKMQELKYVLNAKHPDGAGLLYIREIFEPCDPEYRNLPGMIKVTSLTKEQVCRLRVMIVDEKLQDVMVPTLAYYDRLPYDAIGNVVDHFEHWKVKYAKVRDYRAKFNEIFSFTYALHKFDAWMLRMDRGLGRSRMVAGLAMRWKNLFSSRTPEELNIDDEFSYPALQLLLQSFKAKVEGAPTWRDPRMIFKYD
mmetsp:Transcript_100169/g.150171  ORF Transcript_100169/g.150171 Transcript_100169/m.150171 type:complete len:356 (+) Transcript_100169:104-1171(+)